MLQEHAEAQAYESGASARAHGRERNSPLYAMGAAGYPLQAKWYAGYDAEDAKHAAAAAARNANKQARGKASKAGRR